MDEGNVAASRRFRGNVSHHHAPSASGESSVSDQAHAFAQTSTDQGARGCQHFRHSGSAFGTKVTQDHHIARFDLAVQDGFERRLLIIKYACWAGNDGVFQASDFGDRAFR